jgi:hypothetical protein
MYICLVSTFLASSFEAQKMNKDLLPFVRNSWRAGDAGRRRPEHVQRRVRARPMDVGVDQMNGTGVLCGGRRGRP